MDKPSLPERMSGGFTPHRFADVDISHVHAALQSAADVQHDFEVWNLVREQAHSPLRMCSAVQLPLSNTQANALFMLACKPRRWYDENQQVLMDCLQLARDVHVDAQQPAGSRSGLPHLQWLPITAGLVVRLCPAIDEHENKDLCGPLDARLDGLVAEMAAACTWNPTPQAPS